MYSAGLSSIIYYYMVMVIAFSQLICCNNEMKSYLVNRLHIIIMESSCYISCGRWRRI